MGEGQYFLWAAWKILPVCAQKGGPCERKLCTFKSYFQKILMPALTYWRHRKVTFPCDWSQPSDPSWGHSTSPFFISPGSFNVNLLKCLFIAVSWRLVELRKRANVYRAALRYGIYYIWSFITTTHIRVDGEHDSKIQQHSFPQHFVTGDKI